MDKQAKAAKIIQRFMISNRYRIEHIDINQASKNVIIAKLCIYNYTDDFSDKLSTIYYNSTLGVIWKWAAHTNAETMEKTATHIIQANTRDMNPKKALRYIYQSYTIDELRKYINWCDFVDCA